ncbi:MAG TPA: aldo/keto reductase [Candidatus Dormibacteraeota bacterium]|jgi:aryl-alcohol dehydrogenase-like predicted oxidoreductase|nr:aldo/keto reductase [Candidatus Dormibacteraeota bacterium]
MARDITTITAALAGTIDIGGDLPVNRFGFGAMRLTGEGIWGEPADREECKRVLRRAIELGINFIDTADSYGPEVSERLIAETLYPYPDDLVIATKGGLLRPGPGRWEPDGRPQHLREACEGSLRRLRVDEIDVYQFHRPDPKVPFEESVGALVELKDEGKIRHIGLSNVTVEQLQKAEKLTPIVSIQNRYNLFDRESEPVLEECSLQELAFLPWRPVGGGEMGGEAVLRQIASKYQATAEQLALAWLLQHSPVMLPIPGTSKVAHLEENLAAVALEVAPADLAELDKLAPEP